MKGQIKGYKEPKLSQLSFATAKVFKFRGLFQLLTHDATQQISCKIDNNNYISEDW